MSTPEGADAAAYFDHQVVDGVDPMLGEFEPPAVGEVAAASDVGPDSASGTIRGRHRRRAATTRQIAQARELDEFQARRAEIKLRSRFGYVLLGLLVGQVAIADVVFVVFGSVNGWRIDGTTMQVWLGAAVVQVIGLVFVVVKYLFSAEAAPR